MSKKEKEMKPHFKEIAKFELFVGNLSKGTEKEFKKLDGYRYFQPNRDGQPYGFLGFSSQEETDAAMELLTGKEINGRIIEVRRPNSYKPEKVNLKKELKQKQQLALEKWEKEEKEEKERQQEEANTKLLIEQKAELEYYQNMKKSQTVETSDLNQYVDTYTEWKGAPVSVPVPGSVSVPVSGSVSVPVPGSTYDSAAPPTSGSLLFPNCQKTAIDLQELERQQEFFRQQEFLRIKKIEEEKRQLLEYQSYQIDIDNYKSAIVQANQIIQELERKKYEYELAQEKKRLLEQREKALYKHLRETNEMLPLQAGSSAFELYQQLHAKYWNQDQYLKI